LHLCVDSRNFFDEPKILLKTYKKSELILGAVGIFFLSLKFHRTNLKTPNTTAAGTDVLSVVSIMPEKNFF
jgi:hypothetical protein